MVELAEQYYKTILQIHDQYYELTQKEPYRCMPYGVANNAVPYTNPYVEAGIILEIITQPTNSWAGTEFLGDFYNNIGIKSIISPFGRLPLEASVPEENLALRPYMVNSFLQNFQLQSYPCGMVMEIYGTRSFFTVQEFNGINFPIPDSLEQGLTTPCLDHACNITWNQYWATAAEHCGSSRYLRLNGSLRIL